MTYFSRKALIIFFLLFLFSQLFQSNAQSDFSINRSPLPPPTSPVMDYVGVLDEATRKELERKIIDFSNQTNPRVEMAVVIIDTTGGRDIFEYSLAVARGWGIGSKEADNPSLLLLVALRDKRYFTQVSRDLEDELPDGLVGQIQRQYLVPAFRQGDYARGLRDTIDAYMRTIKEKQSAQGNAPATSKQNNQSPERLSSSRQSSFSLAKLGRILCLIAFLIFIILIIASMSRSRRRGGGDGDFPSFFFFPGGFGGGSWSSGSSDWSSGGDWGGFGGGGDFGGGGAGGDW